MTCTEENHASCGSPRPADPQLTQTQTPTKPMSAEPPAQTSLFPADLFGSQHCCGHSQLLRALRQADISTQWDEYLEDRD